MLCYVSYYKLNLRYSVPFRITEECISTILPKDLFLDPSLEKFFFLLHSSWAITFWIFCRILIYIFIFKKNIFTGGLFHPVFGCLLAMLCFNHVAIIFHGPALHSCTLKRSIRSFSWSYLYCMVQFIILLDLYNFGFPLAARRDAFLFLFRVFI